MAAPAHELDAFVERLSELPFVKAARVRRAKDTGEVRVELRTKAKTFVLRCEQVKSHLTTQAVDYLIATLQGQDVLIVAPAIGRDIGEMLETAGLCFVDAAGNCFVQLGDNYVARIQGRTAEKRPSVQKGMRGPAYRALFALLADDELTTATVRHFAEAAGVSRQAASDIRQRLAEMNILYQHAGSFGWVPHKKKEALEMFVVGYITTLRPQLLLGRYRTADKTPAALERRIKATLPKDSFRFGGGAAAHRMLDGYYHGPFTVLHVDDASLDATQKLAAVIDHNGPLQVLGFPGPLGLRGSLRDVAHPLLVYAELRAEGGERAAEAAAELADAWQ